MINIYIDPYILACPAPEDGDERIDSFIESLLNWRSFRLQGHSNFLQSADTTDALIDTENYPAHPKIEKTLRVSGRNDIQARDVNILIGEILKSSTIEDYMDKHGFCLVDVEKFSSNCEHYLRGRPQEFINCYEWLLCCAGAIKQKESERISKGSSEKPNVHLLRHSQSSDSNQGVAHVKGYVKCLLEDSVETNIILDCGFPICTRANHVDQCVNCSTQWIESGENEGLKCALLEISSEKAAKETGSEISLNFEFGEHFLLTAQDLGFGHEEIKVTRLLRTCADVICELRMGQVHALRIKEGGNSQQMVRAVDGAKAWRRDIDHEYHLHYWMVDGNIEFASVVPHNDFSIP